MSTRRSIIYDAKNHVHVFEDIDGYVWLEIERADTEILIKLMPVDDWRELIAKKAAGLV